jgi:hypothetical protein
MCDPVTLTGLALTAGSTLMSQRASGQVANARNSASAAEAARQQDLQRQSIANFDNTSAGFTRQAQDERLADVTADRGTSLAANIMPATSASAIALPGSAPKVVSDNLGKQLSNAIGEGKSYAQRLGSLGAFNEAQFGNNQALARGAQDTSRLANFSSGSSGILPLELNAANQAGAKTGMFADLLGAAGGVANMGSSVGFNPWATTAVKPAANGMLGRI